MEAEEKGCGADWGTAPHTPILCYFFVNQEVLPAPHWLCSRKPPDIICSHLDHFCYLDQHIHQTYLKDIQISAQQKCTFAHFGLHGNCLHHTAPRCVSMSLTYTAARAPALSSRPRAQFIKTSVGTNLIPPVWRLSHPAVTHNRTAGQRLAGGSQRSKCQTATGKPRKCQNLFLLQLES